MSKYEVKLVNIGEEVDNRIRELEIELKDIRKRNDSLEFAKKHYKKHYLRLADENRIEKLANLTKEVNDLKKENKDAINEGIYLRNENEGYLEEIKELKKSCHLNEVIELRKKNKKLEKRNLEQKAEVEFLLKRNAEHEKHNKDRTYAILDNKMDRLAFLEKLHSQHRYVFSEIPNTEENMRMVKLMKKHINKDRYTVRWRGQYLIDGEDWKKYTDGQPMNKSKCIRVYIDSKGDDTTEGFKESEVDVILDGLHKVDEQCEEFIRSFDIDGEKNDEIDDEKKILHVARQLTSYFTEMKVHLEESKLARAEVTNNVT